MLPKVRVQNYGCASGRNTRAWERGIPLWSPLVPADLLVAHASAGPQTGEATLTTL